MIPLLEPKSLPRPTKGMECFSIPKPAELLDKAKDKVEETGGKTADITKNTIDKTGDMAKGAAKKAGGFGKKIGDTFANIGKGIGKIFSAIFKKILQFLAMLLKYWKIIVGVIIGVFILYIVSKGTGFFKMFTG
jgi:hypothetical protein